jgi:hypothetical protein
MRERVFLFVLRERATARVGASVLLSSPPATSIILPCAPQVFERVRETTESGLLQRDTRAHTFRHTQSPCNFFAAFFFVSRRRSGAGGLRVASAAGRALARSLALSLLDPLHSHSTPILTSIRNARPARQRPAPSRCALTARWRVAAEASTTTTTQRRSLCLATSRDHRSSNSSSNNSSSSRL